MAMRFRIVAFVLAFTTILGLHPRASAAQAARAAGPAAAVRYSARQFFDTTSYGMVTSAGAAFSRDGRSLLIHSDRSGVFNVYALPLAGGEPVQVTRSTDNATFAASYFPADDRILYTADQGGNELNHLYVRQADGNVRDLTPGEHLKAQFLGWSADGRSFFVSSNERNPQMFDVYAYDTATLERRLIWQNDGFLIGDVSRDGRHIAVVRALSSANSDVYLATPGATEPPRLIRAHLQQQ
jgi:hypothetical protein